jgi:transcriptional regulator with XRE-family HTH domain
VTPAQYRKERTQRGLTQAALAALLGVPREAIVRREAGTQPILNEAALAIRALPRTKARRARGPQNAPRETRP